MITTRAERAVVDAAWRILYAASPKYPISQIPEGSTVLVRTVDEHCKKDEAIYDVMIVFRKSEDCVRCAAVYESQVDDSYIIPAQTEVVLLGGIANVGNSVRKTPVTKEDKTEHLRQQVQTRNNKLVMYCDQSDNDNRAYCLTQVRHNRYGQPTSGIVENGGWRIRIDSRGNFFIGDRSREKLYSVDKFSIVYVPDEIAKWKNSRLASYEAIMEWADHIPKEFRTSFEFEEGKIAYPLTTQSVKEAV